MHRIEAPGSIARPPRWATLERELIDLMNGTHEVILEQYTAADGSFLWPPSDDYVGIDGHDDAYESFWNWPLFYALGGEREFLEASHREFDAIVDQFGDVETPYGHPMAVEEYEQCRDWFHHGEGNLFFYNLCLADPADERTRERAERFANFYLPDSPTGNYDGEKKLVRAPMNGSMGPEYCDFSMFPHHSYGHDYNWPRRGLPFQDIEGIDSMEDLTDPENEERLFEVLNERCSRGDNPMNLAITSLVANAYLMSGDEEYREWVEEYTAAWVERTRENGGIVPDNVGLSGEIGEYIDGKWYGGFYGWTWSGWHVIGAPLAAAAENVALLERGDLDSWEMFRSTLDTLLKNAVERTVTPAGETKLYVPHKYGDPGEYDFTDPAYGTSDVLHDDGNVRFEDGWFLFQPLTNSNYLAHLWYASMEESDGDRLRRIRDPQSRDWEYLQPSLFGKSAGGGHDQAWFEYLRGDFPDYPERILELDRYHVQYRLDAVREDEPEERYDSAHYLQPRNPVAEEGLVQLTMGGPRPVYNGGLVMARVRHFDPERNRPGLPPDVAALVERIEADRTVVTLLNLGAEHRETVLQAGAYGEHEFGTVRYGRDLDADAGRGTVGDTHLQVSLPPRSRVTIDADTDRFVNDPTYAFPAAASPES